MDSCWRVDSTMATLNEVNEVDEWNSEFKACLVEIMLGMVEVYSVKGSLDDSKKQGSYISSAMHGKYIKWDRHNQNYKITKKGIDYVSM